MRKKILPVLASYFALPREISVRVGESFSVPVAVDPEGEAQYTVKLQALFSSDVLEASSYAFDSSWIPLFQPGYDVIDNAFGVLVKTGGFPSGFSVRESFGTMRFFAKQAGEGVIRVGSDSFVLNAANEGTLVSGGSVRVVVREPEVPTATTAEPAAPEEVAESASEPTAVSESLHLFDILSSPVERVSVGPPWPLLILFGAGILSAVLLSVAVSRYRRWRVVKKMKEKNL